jgi:hypothetical protein
LLGMEDQRLQHRGIFRLEIHHRQGRLAVRTNCLVRPMAAVTAA